MSLYLRLVVGPVVICDIELFSTTSKPDPDKEPSPQLAGGTGTLAYPDPLEESFGFTAASPRRKEIFLAQVSKR